MSAVKTAVLALRVWAWAAILRPLKHVVPLGTLVVLVRAQGRARKRSPEFEQRLEAYLSASGPFPFKPPGNCLERSLAAYRLLGAAKAEPALVVGVRPVAGGGVEGHVWVRVDGRPLAEHPDRLRAFTPIVIFDAAGRREPGTGSLDALARVRLS